MKIELHEISVRDVTKGYIDSAENGVVGYDGKLNIRPAFQREFIYKDKQRDEVIRTIKKKFPLNVMYWVKDDSGNYELLDGQQRTISVCQYVSGDFSIDHLYFHNLTETEQQQILDYPLMIYICEGTDKEKLDWFKIINIAGEQLTAQELRNAIYTGEWLTEAKKYFSKSQCPAYQIAGDYLSGSAIRQNYLETAIKWIADRDGIEIEDYMSRHQHDTNCNELWLYFQTVINWVKATFPNFRKKLMSGLDWGIYYNKYGSVAYDPKALETRIVELIKDYQNNYITNQKGIYEYLLDGQEKHLNIRAFSPEIAESAYEQQNGICPKCGKHFKFEEMQADHITPWSKGGKTTPDNCQMLCADCNRRKSNI
ncbi:HNH endonuclease family protein [Hominenteromicrobium sp.]|jgi:putative HNH endonuclease domain protein|uniref:HNH endonuclease family protein n=1 Tax=Hominenteromicrobium sp. TaxID=3073581 RepID=UPI003A92D4B7